MTPDALLPWTVLAPLAAASLLLALAHWLPPRLADGFAVLVSLALAGLCLWLARAADAGPIYHWFGGWRPGAFGRPDLVLGISFRADQASLAIAAFIGVLFAASFVFAWGYFDKVHAHFHVLMLLFQAGMTGFCLTGDLFNLFVWFELMSISAFALTAYPLGGSALEGAFTFGVTNAIAGFLMLLAIGLVYARMGTLDLMRMGAIAAHLGRDAVLAAALVLLAGGLLTKAAIVPFHLWLSDAHGVAPSPVSVIFSGAMVSTGLFGFIKLLLLVFANDAALMGIVQPLLIALGGVTAVVGGLMAWKQLHLKRLLAFSTVSHLGIMLAGAATLAPAGTAGLLLYLIGHGLVKGSLFMVAGMMLAFNASADEIQLYAKGRRYWPAGLAMAVAGLLLAGLPLGPLHAGADQIHHAVGQGWIGLAVSVGTVFTGAAVMRAGLRIFAGVSGAPGVEFDAPVGGDKEKSDRPFWLMLLPCWSLIALALVTKSAFVPLAGHALMTLTGGATTADVQPSEGMPWEAIATVVLAVIIAGVSLLRERPTRPAARRLFAIERGPFRALEYLHSGLIGDYVTWTMAGLALLAGWIATS